MTIPADSPRHLRVLRSFVFLILIVLAVAGILLSSFAGFLYLLNVALAGRPRLGADARFLLLLPTLAFVAVILFSSIGLRRKSNKFLYLSISIGILSFSTFVFVPAFRFASDMAAEQLHIWPVNYERVNSPLALQEEREIVSPSRGGPPAGPLVLAWSPDGSRIAAIINPGEPTVVWDRAGRQLSHFDTDALVGPNDKGSLAFINGASQVLSPCCQNAQGDHPLLNIFDAATGKHVRTIDNPQPGKWLSARPMTVSPDQQRVAVVLAHIDEILILRTADGTVEKTYAVHSRPRSIAFSADNKKVVVGSMDGIVSIIDTSTANAPQELQVFPNRADSNGKGEMFDRGLTVGVVSNSPDARYIFAGGNAYAGDDQPRAVVVRASDGRQVASFPLASISNTEQAQWDPKGRYVAILDGANHLFLWRPFAPSPSYAKITLPGLRGRINCMVVSPDGNHIAASTERGFIIFSVGTP